MSEQLSKDSVSSATKVMVPIAFFIPYIVFPMISALPLHPTSMFLMRASVRYFYEA